MKRRLKTIALVITTTALLLAVLAAAAVRFVDVERYRPQIEIAIHEAVGLDCSLGHLSLSLWPWLSLRADQPTLGHAGQAILKADRITFSARLLPLFTRRLELRTITLTKLAGTIKRDRQGNLNLLPVRKATPPLASIPIASLRVEQFHLDRSDLRYEDEATGFTAAAREMDLTLGPFTFIKEGKCISGRELFTGAWEGRLKAGSIRINNLTLDRLSLPVTTTDHLLTLEPITATIYGGKLTAKVTVRNFLGKKPEWAMTSSAKGIDLARLSAALHHQGQMTGPLDVKAALTSSGTGCATLLRRLNGSVAMAGRELTMANIDLDAALSHYAKSQELGLFDLGSVFVLGPFGPLLSKAFDLSGSALGASRGKSRITLLTSDWTIHNGTATAKDVAFATPKHRLAMQGRLDFPNERFVGFQVGVLDPKGCATFTQTIGGTFQHPEIKKSNLLTRAIINPILSLFKKGADAMNGRAKDCATPFYRGRVPHPVTAS